VRRELIAFHPQRDWTRRYWFQEPIPLERGTRLETTVAVDDEIPALPLSGGTSIHTTGFADTPPDAGRDLRAEIREIARQQVFD
jgi:hypothetical protein